MDVTKYFEKFGRYQCCLYFLAVGASIYGAFVVFIHLFLSENHAYRCFIPGCDNNVTSYEAPWLNQTIPFHVNDNGKTEYSSCRMFVSNLSQNVCDLQEFNVNESEICSKWVFQSSQESLARKWDLICDKQWIWDTAESIFMAGMCISSLFVGVLCDRFGRRKSFILYTIVLVLFSIAKVFAPNFTYYLVLNFFIGLASQFSVPVYTLFFESVGPDIRAILGMGLGITYALGELLLVLCAYYITNWKWLLMFVSFSSLIFVLYIFIIPESVVWLHARGDKQKLRNELLKIIKWNQLDSSFNNFDALVEETDALVEETDAKSDSQEVIFSQKKTNRNSFGNPFLLFKTPYLRKCTIAQMVIWFCVALAYFGVTLGSNDVGSNYMVTFALLAAVEIPGIIFGTVALLKWGRKLIQIVLLFICAAVCFSYILIPDDLSTLRTALAVIGKGCTSAQWNINIIYTVELYPTVIRNVGYSSASTCARIAAIIASYIPDLANVYPALPMIIFGSCAVLAAFALFFLPETANKPLMNTIEEVEQMNKFNQEKGIYSRVPIDNPELNLQNQVCDSQEDLSLHF